MASETLDIIIKGRNEAKQQLVGARDALGGIEKAAMGAMGALGLAFGGRELARAVGDLTMLGAQAQRLDRSFRGLAGSGADQMLERLRTASRGTITDMDLMLSANRAMMLGVTQSADELATLLEVAAIRGRAMGLSTQQAFDDMVTGLGRGSVQILDNLGIIIDSQTAYEEYARSIGKATNELTKHEQTQALMAQVMADSQTLVADASNQASGDALETIEQVRVAWENLKKEIGTGLAGALLTDSGDNVLANLLDGISEYYRTVHQLGPIQEALALRLKQLRDEGSLTRAEYNNLTWTLNALNLKLLATTISTDDYIAALDGLATQAGITDMDLMGMANAAASAGDASLAAVPGVNALTGALLEQAQAAQEAYGVAIVRQRLAAIQAERDRDLAAFLSEHGMAPDGTFRGDRLYEPPTPTRRGASGVNEAQRQAEEWARTVKSAVEGVFTTSQVSERDWWETALGVYADKPDEYVRRLRSAITDVNSEWKHLLGGLEGDAARLFVAQQEELWRSGQWSQLGPGFDLGASKEAIVQGALAKMEAERAREALVAEIMGDPRLGGFTAGERERALGMGSEAGGATYAEEWITGAVSVDAGKGFTDAFGEQIKAQEAQWRVFGSLSAGWMIDGMGDAAGNAANALVDVLFPGIYEELRRAGVVATP